jgi:hypothetical protein
MVTACGRSNAAKQEILGYSPGDHIMMFYRPHLDKHGLLNSQEVETVWELICNPVYAGFRPFPALISDEEWVAAAARMIERDGAEQFLVNLLHILRQTFANDGDSLPYSFKEG